MNDYPTKEELERIRKWPLNEYESLMEFVHSIWWMPDWGWRQKGKTYHISTGGWSGNEDIICAMQDNDNFFWTMCWESSRRGGHYVFKVPRMKEKVLP
jgi:hypothetical protein